MGSRPRMPPTKNAADNGHPMASAPCFRSASTPSPDGTVLWRLADCALNPRSRSGRNGLHSASLLGDRSLRDQAIKSMSIQGKLLRFLAPDWEHIAEQPSSIGHAALHRAGEGAGLCSTCVCSTG